MTALVWNETGKKFYEAGVDRGVLYVGSNPGVPWLGLVAVEESPTGGEPTPYYADGFKYLNLTTSEEFEATIEAFSAPREFAVCEGRLALHTGLFVGEQPRKQFGFSYRTLIGNDIQGLDYGYKLHLVYNAVVNPVERTHSTLTDSPELDTTSWDISTTPVVFPGKRPTAHIVINSRNADPLTLGYLEGIIYGANGIEPRLPNADEVMAIMGMPNTGISFATNLLGLATGATKSLKNLLINPSFESGAASFERRRNFASDPLATKFLTAANYLGWKSGRWFGTAPAAGVYSLVTDAVDGPVMPDGTQITTYARKTWTVAPATIGNSGDTGFDNSQSAASAYAVTVGDTLAISGYLRPSVDRNFEIGIYQYDAAGTVVGTRWRSATVIGRANEWLRLGAIYTVPAGVAKIMVVMDSTTSAANGAQNWIVGSTLDGTGLMLEKARFINTLIWGGRPSDDCTYSWVGAANDSPSIQTGYKVAWVGDQNNARTMWSSRWSKSGTYSLRCYLIGDAYSTEGYASIAGGFGGSTLSGYGVTFVPGKTYTVIATCRLEAPQTATHARARTIQACWNTVAGWTGAGSANSEQAPNIAGETELRVTFTVPANAVWAGVRLGVGAGENGGDVWWDDVAIVEVPSSAEPYEGEAFYGGKSSIISGQYAVPVWDGTPHNSTSTVQYIDLFETPGVVGDTYIVNGNLWVFNDDGYWFNMGPDPLA